MPACFTLDRPTATISAASFLVQTSVFVYYTQQPTSLFGRSSCIFRYGCFHISPPHLWTVPITTFSNRLRHGWRTVPEQDMLVLTLLKLIGLWGKASTDSYRGPLVWKCPQPVPRTHANLAIQRGGWNFKSQVSLINMEKLQSEAFFFQLV